VGSCEHTNQPTVSKTFSKILEYLLWEDSSSFWALPLSVGEYISLCNAFTRDKWALHQGMARPQVADGGMASNMEGSSKYIE
jgi:hypothetical protein